MRLKLLALLCLALAAISTPISPATAAPGDVAAQMAKFKAQCAAHGGTLSQVKPGVLKCTAPNGGAQVCDYSGKFGVCIGQEPPAYDPATGQKNFISQCVAEGGKIQRTPKRGVLICVASNGAKQLCDFTQSFGAVCTGQEAPPKTYDHSAEIGKQASKCFVNGGTFTPGPPAGGYTCADPDGSGETCVYSTDSPYGYCYGFEGAPANKPQSQGTGPSRGGRL